MSLSPKTTAPGPGLTLTMLASLLLAGWVAQPFFSILLLGGALAVSCYPAQQWLTQAFGQRPRLAAAVFASGLGLVLLLPVAGAGAFVVQEATAGMEWLQQAVAGSDQLDTLADVAKAHLPDALQQHVQPAVETLHLTPDDLRAYAGKVIQALRPSAAAALQGSVAMPGYAALMLLALYFLLVDGKKLMPMLVDVLPLPPARAKALLAEMRDVLKATVLGNVVTAVVQCSGVTLGLWLASVPHALFLGLLALPASFIPVAGSALIWLPAAAIQAATGQPVAAALLVGGLGTLSTINTNVIKPAVLGGRMTLHPGLVFVAILGGIKVFGMVGLVAGPLAIALGQAMLVNYRQLLRASTATSGTPDDSGADVPQILPA